MKKIVITLIVFSFLSAFADTAHMKEKGDVFTDNCIGQKIISPTRFVAKCEDSGIITVKLKFLADYANTYGLYLNDLADFEGVSGEAIIKRYNSGKQYMANKVLGKDICILTNGYNLYSSNGNVMAMVWDEECNNALNAQRSLNFDLLKNGDAFILGINRVKYYNLMEQDFINLLK